jgi:transcriptional regulator with AAA-type ATPase domain/transcriptional regulatory protein LevR
MRIKMRKDIVYDVLKAKTQYWGVEEIFLNKTGVTTEGISQLTNIARSNVSKELNILVNEGKVVKVLGRPVFYFSSEFILKILGDQEIISGNIYSSYQDLIEHIKCKTKNNNKNRVGLSSFENLIGYSDSLINPIKQAKAAVLYPPNGLHTLLIGSTGVGKTTFAETMYKYSCEVNHSEVGKFVIFNCAEYAANPQFLLSQLFGHVKGAYTGAESDKIGLVEEADTGVLFLDEIHRLPPEGQEMLFMLMDKGIYRRMGESSEYRKSNIMLIGATTEDIKSSLLNTFVRRIPMIIKLPSLTERTLKERVCLIKQFFSEECVRMGKKIYVQDNVMKALATYECNGNIGQLKSDVQLICAKCFMESYIEGEDFIEIDLNSLSENIFNYLIDVENLRSGEIDSIINQKVYLFTGESESSFSHINEEFDLYNMIVQKYNYYKNREYSNDEIYFKLNDTLLDYVSKIIPENIEDKKNLGIYKFVTPRIFKIVSNALSIAEKRLHRKYSKNVYIALAMHISQLVQRIKEKSDITVDSDLYPENSEDLNVLKEIVEYIQKQLNIIIPDYERNFLSIFLKEEKIKGRCNDNDIGIILLAHGRSTATSIAEVVNSLLNTDRCYGIDMALDEKVESVLDKTIELAKKFNKERGILFLVDMGSLTAFGRIVEDKTGIKTRTVELLNTPMAIEAVRKSMFIDMNLEKLEEELKKFTPSLGKDVKEYIIEKEITQKKTILCCCPTGVGTSKQIADLLKSKLSEWSKIDILNISLKDAVNSGIVSTRNVVAIVTTTPIFHNKIPNIMIDEIFDGTGINRLVLLSGIENFDEEMILSSNTLRNVLADSLFILNPDRVFKLTEKFFFTLSKEIRVDQAFKFRMKFIIHCSCMIERLITGSALIYQEVEKKIRKNQYLYQSIKNHIQIIEDTFPITVPDTEIAYIMDIYEDQGYSVTH